MNKDELLKGYNVELPEEYKLEPAGLYKLDLAIVDKVDRPKMYDVQPGCEYSLVRSDVSNVGRRGLCNFDRYKMIDICCGTKSVSRAFWLQGWKVLTVDINSDFRPGYCVDVREWVYDWEADVDFIWCSPPCTEFSYWSRGFYKDPDLSIYQACLRLISEIKPKYWIIENVKGAVRYFGRQDFCINPFYFWTNTKNLKWVVLGEERYKTDRKTAVERAIIPEVIVDMVFESVMEGLKL